MELDSSTSSSSCKSCNPDSESSSDPAPSKRKAGRKKFKETRHPVFRGVRKRKGNKWVCEVREPHKKTRIWLGTFPTPVMAARAYDVAALALRGKSAALNFTDSASILPRAKSCSPKDIQTAALAAADAFRPTTTTCCNSSPSLSPDDHHMISSHSTSSTNYYIDQPCLVVENENDQEKKVLDYSISMDHNHASFETNPNQSDHIPLFIDEEALFNMPELLNSMAEGMLIAPPTMSLQRQVDRDDDTASTINIDLWGA
ncbi:hypothetical protein PTKIN_Ptkin11bG0054900 [Pterospermum kingtungense]